MYKIIKTIVISDTVPQNTDVLWLKPMGKGFVFYWWNNGKWNPMELVNTHGTPQTEEDTLIDAENIPSIDSLEDKIKEEVTTQMVDHDKNVNDVHFEDSQDPNEYPDYSDII